MLHLDLQCHDPLDTSDWQCQLKKMLWLYRPNRLGSRDHQGLSGVQGQQPNDNSEEVKLTH